MAERAGWQQQAPCWLAALWWGSLSALMALVVPLLFVHSPSPALAAAMAARLFTAQTWLGMLCGLVLLLLSRSKSLATPIESIRQATVFIVAGMLLALLGEFAVAPRIMSRENLRLWHALGSLLYLMQWGCVTMTLARLLRSARAS